MFSGKDILNSILDEDPAKALKDTKAALYLKLMFCLELLMACMFWYCISARLRPVDNTMLFSFCNSDIFKGVNT